MSNSGAILAGLPKLPVLPRMGAEGSAGPFSPSDIAGLQAWWEDTGIQVTGPDVTSWTDSSGNGKTIFPPSTMPVLNAGSLNGHNVVDFNSADGNAGTPLNHGTTLISGTASTMFAVVFRTSFWNEAGFYTTRLTFQANHHPFSDNAVYDANFSTARKSCGAQVVTISDNWRIFAIRSQDNDYRMEIGGVSQFTTATNLFNSGTDFMLGAGAFDGSDTLYAMQGSIAEVLVYNAFLSDAQVDQVGGYLAERFALTWTP